MNINQQIVVNETRILLAKVESVKDALTQERQAGWEGFVNEDVTRIIVRPLHYAFAMSLQAIQKQRADAFPVSDPFDDLFAEKSEIEQEIDGNLRQISEILLPPMPSSDITEEQEWLDDQQPYSYLINRKPHKIVQFNENDIEQLAR